MDLQVEIAEAIARVAHYGQVDKTGADYIEHLQRVAGAVRTGSQVWDAPYYPAVGWLHDVLEDTFVTEEHLKAARINEIVVEAVVLLTKIPGEPNVDYYNRIKNNRFARAVKIADMKDNLDPKRLAKLDDETIARLVKKYAKGLEILGG